ncbi:MAG TPA: rhomboid family intramembrane serine protease [Caulobacteraceae bacterium]
MNQSETQPQTEPGTQGRPQGWGQPQPWGEPRPEREPMFNAPWTIVVLCVGLVVLYGLQRLTMTDAMERHWALSAVALEAGRWQTLLSSMFLHGSWPHVLMNSVALLAFGPPTARLLGLNARGAGVFFLFYLVCGVVAGLGFVAVDLKDAALVVGASGAVSGLLGAASRIIQGHGRIGPITGSTVIGMAIAWAAVNVVLGVSGLTPGAMGMPVAWQAHLVGYAAGVVLIGPFARLAGRTSAVFTR